ncbi:hypothetical protein ASG58_11445 [Rhizobium sp. Leaf383]|nr:hypothetical protein ASG58_11445 [Rhizobium sp. Leaf383]
MSAAALFTPMFAAVHPFGRVDMIGHATIFASLLIVLADPQRADAMEIAPRRRRDDARACRTGYRTGDRHDLVCKPPAWQHFSAP